MPEIQVNERFTPTQQLAIIGAHALFPENEAIAQCWAIRSLLPDRLRTLDPDTELSVPVKVLSWLLEGPDRTQLEKAVANRRRDGATAGTVLMIMHAMQAANIEPSINRAAEIIVLSAERRQASAYSGAVRLRGDSGDIKKAWKRMSSVAHIHAAVLGFETALRGHQSSLSEAKVLRMQGIMYRQATAFLSFGISTRSSAHARNRKPLIDPDIAWRLPPNLGGSIEETPRPPRIDELPPWLIDDLRRYKAPTIKSRV